MEYLVVHPARKGLWQRACATPAALKSARETTKFDYPILSYDDNSPHP